MQDWSTPSVGGFLQGKSKNNGCQLSYRGGAWCVGVNPEEMDLLPATSASLFSRNRRSRRQWQGAPRGQSSTRYIDKPQVGKPKGPGTAHPTGLDRNCSSRSRWGVLIFNELVAILAQAKTGCCQFPHLRLCAEPYRLTVSE